MKREKQNVHFERKGGNLKCQKIEVADVVAVSVSVEIAAG